jgi:bacteriocin biosynthesis cyclodehydratase domain-containing protein
VPQRPQLRFAPHLEILPVRGLGLVAVGERGCDVFSGSEFARLGELVDGPRDEEAIIAACDGAERDAVATAISALRRAGLLVESPNGAGSGDQQSWWLSQWVPPAVAAARLRESSVRVQGLGQVDVGPAIEALHNANVRVHEDGELAIVLVGDYLDQRLAELNSRALSEGRAWMLAQPRGARVLAGPVFSPGRGPCWECLAERLRANRSVLLRARALSGGGQTAPSAGAPAGQLALGPELIATEAARWLAGARPGLESTMLSFDVRDWQGGSHRVAWRPQCPACGEGDASLDRGAAPIKIRRSRSAKAPAVALRTVAPKRTLERFEHHVDPLVGAVHSLTRMGTPDHIHVYTAGGPIPRVHGDRRGWEPLTGMPSSGKGTTDELARASALCEALERYSGQFFGDEPRRLATFEELADAAVDPNEYMRFSDSQFDQRERWNERAASLRTYVPERFDPGDRIEWTPAWSLTHQRERLVPTALCYYGADVAGAAYCVAESNGNAAGNTIEEAILHAMLELVERDHVALWWYNRVAAPAVDLDTIDDPWLRRLRAHVAGEGRELWAVDLTADLAIPAAAMLVASADGSGIGIGFGAHLDLGGAVIRAATELAQLGLGGVSGGLGTGAGERLHLDQHPYLRPDPHAAPRSCAAGPAFEGDVEAALDLCRRAIEQRGIELLVLDQTRPDIGLPVVKVMAPGMRHFWPRFGAGRLYDVPVELGWLDRAREEDELNDIPPVS